MPLHVIQFAGREEYGRAVIALGEVPRTRVGLPEFKMVVEDDHIKALNQAGVPVRRNVLPAGAGWPLLYGGKCEQAPNWERTITEQFESFVRDISSQPIALKTN